MSVIRSFFALLYPDPSLKGRVDFYSKMSELYRSGIPLLRCCEVTRGRTNDPRLLRILDHIIDRIQEGDDFADILSTHESDLGLYDVHLLIAGERAGKLEESLAMLHRQYSKQFDLRQIAVGAATGPLFTIVLFLLFFSLFDLVSAGLFAYLKATLLPIISLGTLWLLLSATWRWLMTLRSFRIAVSAIAVSLPIVGSLKKLAITARFADAFAFLYEAGLPAQDILRLSAMATGEPEVETTTQRMLAQQADTWTWEEVLPSVPHLTTGYLDAISVAVETGRLDRVSRDIADQTARNLEKRMQTLLPIAAKLITIPILMIIFFAKVFTVAISLLSLFIERIQEIFFQQINR